jgi:hypothetical protein
VLEHKQAATGSRSGTGRRFRWLHRGVAAQVEPLPRVHSEDGRIVIVQQKADFVCCSYRGCGALRPLVETAQRLPCQACGRV